MALVSGTLNDANLGHLAGRAPKLIFTLSEPATSDAGMFVTEPIIVTPNSNGAFVVDLEPTETMHQKRHYDLSVQWLDAAGNFIKVDFPDWDIFVPRGGGAFPDLIPGFTSNPFMIFWQATEPNPWPVGTVWVNSITGDVLRKDS